MICPKCFADDPLTTDTRSYNHGKEVRRRRRCRDCGYRWTTLEIDASKLKRTTSPTISSSTATSQH
jgi:transcriptional regulator NrdR family protein